MTTTQIADGLLSGNQWYKGYLTYSFKDEAAYYEYADDRDGITPLSNAAREAVHEVMAYVSSLLGITISYSADSIGDIAIASKTMNELTLGYSYMPGTSAKNSSGDIFLNANYTDVDYKKGGMAYGTIIHELGHALGLDHPFGEGDYAGVDVNDTVMSYNRYEGYDSITNNSYSIYSFSSYQEADIVALRSIYGAYEPQSNDTYILKDELFSEVISGYTVPITDNVHTINDDGGDDTISLAGIDNNLCYLDMSANTQSVIVYGDVHHYLNLTSTTIIENAIGSYYNDTFVLNNTHNTIDGGGGTDKAYITASSDLRIDKLENKVMVSSKDSGLDTISNIEEIYINSELINSSSYQRTEKLYTHENADDIARLYLSVFDRLADEAGLDYWVNDFISGTSLRNISASFVLSDEFSSLYGSSQSDSEYINLLYQNVLYRDADSAGLEYWLNDMAEGALRADVLVSFSSSQEFIDLTSDYFRDSNIFLL